MWKEKMKNRVLILVPSLQVSDGISNAILKYLSSALAQEWQIDFITTERPDGTYRQQLQALHSHIYTIPQTGKYSIPVRKYCIDLLNRHKHHILHINFSGEISRILVVEAKKHGCKIIFHVHNPINKHNFKWVVSAMLYDSVCIKNADRLIACSKEAGRSRFRNRHFFVLNNIIYTDHFLFDPQKRKELRENLNISQRKVIGVVARFVPQKNPLFIVDCFLNMYDLDHSVYLLWIGDGDMMSKVKERLCRSPAADSFCFAGIQSDVGPWYSAMDAFLLPSKFEGMGIVFLEAQDSGLPCFGSKQVPSETKATDLMHRWDLNFSAEIWAVRILKIMDEQKQRRSRDQELRTAGFDVSCNNQKQLISIYKKLLQKN